MATPSSSCSGNASWAIRATGARSGNRRYWPAVWLQRFSKLSCSQRPLTRGTTPAPEQTRILFLIGVWIRVADWQSSASEWTFNQSIHNNQVFFNWKGKKLQKKEAIFRIKQKINQVTVNYHRITSNMWFKRARIVWQDGVEESLSPWIFAAGHQSRIACSKTHSQHCCGPDNVLPRVTERNTHTHSMNTAQWALNML